MVPALPIMSASIPQIIDVSFGLMPLVAAIVIVAIGSGEILRAALSSRDRGSAQRARFRRAAAQPALAVK